MQVQSPRNTIVYNMAAEAQESDCGIPVSYIFVRVLGSGAFGEAVLYQKTEVSIGSLFF